MSTNLGETSLATLLKTLTVTIHTSTFAFFSLPVDFTTTLHLGPSRQPIAMLFFEPGEERYTAIVDTMQLADAQGRVIDSNSPGVDASPVVWKMLTLNVHSSLEAVGFIAAISKALADAHIPCNCVAAYFHDHIFVQADMAEKAIKVIEDVACNAGK